MNLLKWPNSSCCTAHGSADVPSDDFTSVATHRLLCNYDDPMPGHGQSFLSPIYCSADRRGSNPVSYCWSVSWRRISEPKDFSPSNNYFKLAPRAFLTCHWSTVSNSFLVDEISIWPWSESSACCGASSALTDAQPGCWRRKILTFPERLKVFLSKPSMCCSWLANSEQAKTVRRFERILLAYTPISLSLLRTAIRSFVRIVEKVRTLLDHHEGLNLESAHFKSRLMIPMRTWHTDALKIDKAWSWVFDQSCFKRLQT